MRPLFVLCLAPVLLAGCASSSVDTSNWTPAQIARHNADVDASNQFYRDLGNTRYPTTTVAPQTVQPNVGTTAGEQYQTIAVNTPAGLVYKRCKVLNGQVVACF